VLAAFVDCRRLRGTCGSEHKSVDAQTHRKKLTAAAAADGECSDGKKSAFYCIDKLVKHGNDGKISRMNNNLSISISMPFGGFEANAKASERRKSITKIYYFGAV